MRIQPGLRQGLLLTAGLLLLETVLAPPAWAYGRFLDGCQYCHEWTAAPHASPKGYSIPVSLHDLHRNSGYMNAGCDLCHSNGDQKNPYLGTSSGSASTPGYGCAGCHGNTYAGVARSPGLRARHARSGITSCAGCHSGDPVPHAESVTPPYYGKPDSRVASSCNDDTLRSEDWAGVTTGLDNDGDGLYDQADPDCSCTPTTCAAQGKNCGSISDGCGGTLTCGTCTSPETCGGSGAANVCGAGTCTPTTCAGQGKNCGTISDGCGGTLDCGTCASPETCGGSGTANVCGVAACTPTTCSAQGMTCGGLADGCGGTLDCGGCSEGDSCVDGTCRATTPPDAGTPDAGSPDIQSPDGGTADPAPEVTAAGCACGAPGAPGAADLAGLVALALGLAWRGSRPGRRPQER